MIRSVGCLSHMGRGRSFRRGAHLNFSRRILFRARFLLGLFNGTLTASKTLVSEVCGKEHEVVGMGVVTSELS